MPKLSREQVRKRERELMEHHRAQQRTVQRELFPSLQKGGRGSVSPLGGVAQPAPKRGSR